MYETHFGLNKRPFRAFAEGSDAFVGPQAAGTMAAVKKALVGSDAIVAVAGPVGVGKTTVVRRALAGLGGKTRIVSIGRIQLGHDEVLEMLLEELGIPMPVGTVQRFTTLRRQIKEYEDQGSHIVVVVEDAARVGADALAELEALTAADAGVSEGARVVLMGDESMAQILQSPRLARLKQRLRLRQQVSPLSSNELMGYFKHCFRLAGQDFDTIFEQGSAAMLHALSDGIPRMANGLVESCLISAAENKQATVSVELIQRVAKAEYALDVDLPDVRVTPEKADVHIPVVAPGPTIQPEPIAAPKPVAEPLAAEPVPAELNDELETEEEPIPELIQDTLPDLSILSPALAKAAAQEHIQVAPEAPAEPDVEEEIPTLSDEDAVPEWERDPTLAQLRPDLDALNHAMAVAQGLEPDDDEEFEPKAEEVIPELVPEITLDREIQAKIEEAAELLKQAEREAAGEGDEVSDKAAPERKPAPEVAPKVQPAPKSEPVSAKPAIPVVTPPVVKPLPAREAVAEKPELEELAIRKPAVEEPVARKPAQPAIAASDKPAQEKDKKADAELERIAMNLSRAKTIDDCDDKMAETLFGEEFSMMAAQVAANAPPEFSANDSMELELEQSAAFQVTDFEGAAALNVELESNSSSTGKLDASASQRLATVRALNAAPGGPSHDAASIAMSHYEAPPPPPSDSAQPESIEDQINTSITQTLKALSVRPPQNLEEDDEPKGGFFSRFRRS
jgi:general secretion pathway protein A